MFHWLVSLTGYEQHENAPTMSSSAQEIGVNCSVCCMTQIIALKEHFQSCHLETKKSYCLQALGTLEMKRTEMMSD
jgi:hypothetical protein